MGVVAIAALADGLTATQHFDLRIAQQRIEMVFRERIDGHHGLQQVLF